MKEILKFAAFRIVCPLLVFFRVDRLLQLFSSRKRLIIYFHGVSHKKYYHINGRHMDVKQFEELLRYLKSNFDILSVEKLCENQKENKILSRKAIALSFDDGFLNNVDVALPMLEKYRIPATFFISSASLNDPTYIHPSDLIDLLKLGMKTGEKISINGEEFILSGNELVHRETRQTLLDYLNSLSFEKLKSTVQAILDTFGYESLTKDVDPTCYRLMSEKDIANLKSNALISIASHSHYHVNMPTLSVEEMHSQLKMSRESLERCTGHSIRSLAFPYGHYNDASVEAATKNGFEYIFAGGDVASATGKVFPRVGVLSMRGFAFNVLSISRAFGRFGF